MNFNVGFSQSNINLTTKWTYSERNLTPFEGPQIVSIESDTTINGTVWYEANGIEGCASPFNTYIREFENKVLLLDTSNFEEIVLYNYALGKGDQYDIRIPNSEIVYSITIDSIGSKIFDGIEYEIQYISAIDFGEFIIKGIGSNKFLTPQGNICDPQFRKIRCFENNSIEYDFDTEHECEEVINTLSSEETNTFEYKIYLNPTYQNINIDFGEPVLVDDMEIHNYNGSLINSIKLNQTIESYVLNIENLLSGSYFIRMKTNRGAYYSKIIVL